MSFNRAARAIAVLGIPLLLTACGVLPNAKEPKKLLEMADGQGCLNELGPRVDAYLLGQIDAETWSKTWDCTADAMDLFKTYAKGSLPQGYTQTDIRNFLQKFLITNQEITPELVQVTYELKAALFGGNPEVLTPEEFAGAIDVVKVIRDESTKLLPFMKARHEHPEIDSLVGLQAQMAAFGAAVGKALPVNPSQKISEASLETLFREFGKLFAWEIPDGAGKAILESKNLFVGGPQDGVTGADLSKLFPVAAALGGAVVAVTSFPERLSKDVRNFSVFYNEVAQRLKSISDSILQANGGRVPLSRVDRVLDAVPAEWLPTRASILKETLRPVANRVLQASVPNTLGPESFEVIFNIMDRWARGTRVLYDLFDETGMNIREVENSEFISTAYRYAEKMRKGTDKDAAYFVISLAEKFKPLYPFEESEALLVRNLPNNRDNLAKMIIFRLIAEHLMVSYSPLPDRSKVSADDLLTFIRDYLALGQELKVIGDLVPKAHERRLTESDYFTPASNGDGFMDVDEATYYLAFLVSINNQSVRIRDAVTRCGIGEYDLVGWEWLKPSCFREEFFAKAEQLWNRMPIMLAHYLGMSKKDRQSLIEYQMEFGSRRYGHTELLMASVDLQGFAGILHFIESVVLRFDGDQNDWLNTKEVLNATPVFKRVIAQVGGLSPSQTSLIEAAFTYTVHHRYAPEQNVGGYAHFLLWYAARPFWNLHADRTSIYALLPILIPPDPIPPGADR